MTGIDYKVVEVIVYDRVFLVYSGNIYIIV